MKGDLPCVVILDLSGQMLRRGPQGYRIVRGYNDGITCAQYGVNPQVFTSGYIIEGGATWQTHAPGLNGIRCIGIEGSDQCIRGDYLRFESL